LFFKSYFPKIKASYVEGLNPQSFRDWVGHIKPITNVFFQRETLKGIDMVSEVPVQGLHLFFIV